MKTEERGRAAGEMDPVAKLFADAHAGANRCIQCGYCLPVCPTYHSMGRETQSPRGRINLVKAAAEGRIAIDEDMAGPLELCLGCRACEVACPVGVPYGEIFEAAREATVAENERKGKRGMRQRVERFVLEHLFPYSRRMRLAGNLVWFGRITGVQALAFRSGLVGKFSPALAALGEVTPPDAPPWQRMAPGSVFAPRGERKARVAFFQGCVMDAVMHRINRLSVELLREVGCEVIIPDGQTCCGALHAHQGYRDGARDLARRNINAFEGADADYFVNNAGGCGAMLRETGHLFSSEPGWNERATAYQEKWRDLSEVLVECGPLPVRRKSREIVTCQDSCHLRYVQKASEAPRVLLRQVAGERFIEMPGAGDCCASAGIYNILHFKESMTILDEKMKKARGTGAAVITTTNPGCHLQMRLGVRRAGLEGTVRAVHLAEFLAECVLPGKPAGEGR